MSPKLLWIGLGNMGSGMAKNIAEKAKLDQPLMLYNRTTQKAHDFSQKLPAGKSEVVSSLPEGVSKADIVFICLSNDAVVESTVGEILKGDVAGKLVVDMSTIHPDTTDRIAKAVHDKGAEFVAAPVFGAPPMAESGQLVTVMAGPKAAVDKVRPYFKGVTSKAEIDMADQPYRKALIMKMVGNTFILNMNEQLAESHVFAEKIGLDANVLHDWISTMFPGPYAAYSKRMMTGDYYDREFPAFQVDLARKDAGHALNLAKSVGVRLPNTEIADAHLAQVKKIKGDKGDIAGIYGVVRMEAGLKYENKE